MKSLLRCVFLGLSLSVTASFAQSERLNLAFTDRLPDNPLDCLSPGLSSIGSITEEDVAVWLPADSRWYFDPERADPTSGAKVLNRCFVLSVDGKEITRGIALASDSERISTVPTLSVNQDTVLTFALVSGHQVRSVAPIHADEIKRVLGQKANLRVQMGRSTPFAGRTGPGPLSWRSTLQTLIAAHKIRPNMSMASIFSLLGQPTVSVDEPEGKGQIMRWYFASPMHVNPMFVAVAREGLVKEFAIENR